MSWKKHVVIGAFCHFLFTLGHDAFETYSAEKIQDSYLTEQTIPRFSPRIFAHASQQSLDSFQDELTEPFSFATVRRVFPSMGDGLLHLEPWQGENTLFLRRPSYGEHARFAATLGLPGPYVSLFE